MTSQPDRFFSEESSVCFPCCSPSVPKPQSSMDSSEWIFIWIFRKTQQRSFGFATTTDSRRPTAISVSMKFHKLNQQCWFNIYNSFSKNEIKPTFSSGQEPKNWKHFSLMKPNVWINSFEACQSGFLFFEKPIKSYHHFSRPNLQ